MNIRMKDEILEEITIWLERDQNGVIKLYTRKQGKCVLTELSIYPDGDTVVFTSGNLSPRLYE